MDQSEKLVEDLMSKDSSVNKLWVFGYGSILWKHNFDFCRSSIGYVEGYDRRFWQGSIAHRGSPDKPGRCATLVKSNNKRSRVWGLCFELVGRDMIINALDHLGARECLLGGYIAIMTPFFPREKLEGEGAISSLFFTASEDNPLFLGPLPIPDIANQVVSTRGPSGPNAQYVMLLYKYINDNIPEDKDVHLIHTARWVRKLCQEQCIALDLLVDYVEDKDLADKNMCSKCFIVCYDTVCQECNCDILIPCANSIKKLTTDGSTDQQAPVINLDDVNVNKEYDGDLVNERKLKDESYNIVLQTNC